MQAPAQRGFEREARLAWLGGLFFVASGLGMGVFLAALACLFLAAPASAEDAAVARGRNLAEINCAVCHAIGPVGPSPIEDATPFRDIALGYDLMDLEDSLNEGVATEHPLMPDWQVTPEQAHALASYIMSLAPSGKLRSNLDGTDQLRASASP